MKQKRASRAVPSENRAARADHRSGGRDSKRHLIRASAESSTSFAEDWQAVEFDRMCRELGLQLARAVQPEPAVLAHIDHELDQHLVDLVDLLGLTDRAGGQN
jgi:hypothetical protein